jgi:hypothetical protein
MRPIITLCFAVPLVVLGLEAKAQQLTPTEAARAAAAGPEFCPRSPCPGAVGALLPGAAKDIAKHSRSTSPTAQNPKTSGPFPPQPYQHSRSEVQAAAPAEQHGPGGDPWARQFEEEHGPPRTKFDSIDDELEYRSHRIFPDFQNEPARQQWIMAQKQRAIANEINTSKALLYPVSGR